VRFHLPLLARVLRERWRGLTGWITGLVSLVAVQVAVYPTIRDSREGWSDLTEQFPEAIRKIIRMEDYTSPAGYLTTELFSFMFPLIFTGVACSWAARAGAEEEENGTADILLSLPVSRGSILFTRLVAVFVALAGVCVAGIASLAVGTRSVDMDVGTAGIAAATVSCALLGTVFASASVVAAAWTGRRGVGLGTGLGLAVVLFVAYSLAPLVGFFDRILALNPYQWTIGQSPLADGIDPALALVALLTITVLCVVAQAGFSRRDIRA
jgi:ABC-2 type transport system permease protein